MTDGITLQYQDMVPEWEKEDVAPSFLEHWQHLISDSADGVVRHFYLVVFVDMCVP